MKHTEKHSDPRDTQPDPIPGSFAEEKGFGLHSSKACAEGVGVGWLDVAYLGKNGKMILNHVIWYHIADKPIFRIGMTIPKPSNGRI